MIAISSNIVRMARLSDALFQLLYPESRTPRVYPRPEETILSDIAPTAFDNFTFGRTRVEALLCAEWILRQLHADLTGIELEVQRDPATDRWTVYFEHNHQWFFLCARSLYTAVLEQHSATPTGRLAFRLRDRNHDFPRSLAVSELHNQLEDGFYDQYPLSAIDMVHLPGFSFGTTAENAYNDAHEWLNALGLWTPGIELNVERLDQPNRFGVWVLGVEYDTFLRRNQFIKVTLIRDRFAPYIINMMARRNAVEPVPATGPPLSPPTTPRPMSPRTPPPLSRPMSREFSPIPFSLSDAPPPPPPLDLSTVQETEEERRLAHLRELDRFPRLQ